MDASKRDLITTVGSVASDAVPLFGIPANLATTLLGQYMNRKAEEARQLLLEELRAGNISEIEAASEDDAVGVTYSYMLAARDNAARFNLRLLAKAITGQLRRHQLYADEFQRHKEVLSRITPDQALVLGRFIVATKRARQKVQQDEEIDALARRLLKDSLIPAAFEDEHHLDAICAQVASLGLLLPMSGFGMIVYGPSPLLFALCELIDFEDAVTKEANR